MDAQLFSNYLSKKAAANKLCIYSLKGVLKTSLTLLLITGPSP
jgi:hypothetical protein